MICVTRTSSDGCCIVMYRCDFHVQFLFVSHFIVIWWLLSNSWMRSSVKAKLALVRALETHFFAFPPCYVDIHFRESRTQTSLFSQHYRLVNSRLRTFDTLDPRIGRFGGFSAENPPTDTLYHKFLISRRHKSPFPRALAQAYGRFALII